MLILDNVCTENWILQYWWWSDLIWLLDVKTDIGQSVLQVTLGPWPVKPIEQGARWLNNEVTVCKQFRRLRAR
jgi:hypothetical protein